MPQVFYKWTEWTDDNRWEEKVMQYTRGMCVQIRQYLSLVSDTEVEKYWKKPNELIFKAHIKKVLFLKTFSCLVVLATSSVRIGLLIGKTAKHTKTGAHNCPFLFRTTFCAQTDDGMYIGPSQEKVFVRCEKKREKPQQRRMMKHG